MSNIHPTAKIHPLAYIDESAIIAEDCVVWQFASVLKGVRLGRGVSVGAGAEIGCGSIIGAGSRISAQVFLPSNSVLGERVFCGPGAKFADDRNPFAGNFSYLAQPPTVDSGVSIGMGAIIVPPPFDAAREFIGIHIGTGAMIAAGAIVTHDVAAHEHVRGEPARVKPYSKVHTETIFDIYSADIRDRVIAGESVRVK